MLQAWGRAVARRRWAVLAAALVGAVLAGIVGPGVVSRLSSGGFDTDGSQAVRADQRITATVGRQDTDVVALYHSDQLTVDDPAFRQAVDRSLATLPAADVAVRGHLLDDEGPRLRLRRPALDLRGDPAGRPPTSALG